MFLTSSKACIQGIILLKKSVETHVSGLPRFQNRLRLDDRVVCGQPSPTHLYREDASGWCLHLQDNFESQITYFKA